MRPNWLIDTEVRRTLSYHESVNTLDHLHPTLAVAVAAARSAAALIRAAVASPEALQIRQKRPNDFVTQVDEASEQAIVRTLLAAFPDHAVRGEESQQMHGKAGSEHVWMVDPLDGTTNFIHGYPAYSVSIALCVSGCVQHGVVLDVNSGDIYHASRGHGAFCNARPLRVAQAGGLEGALLATSCPYRPGPDFADSLQMLGAVMLRVAGIRRSGSAALDLAWTAAGYCDACFDLGLNAWDVAAGSLLVQEAGGLVGNFHREPDFLESRQCMAGNAAVLEALGQVLQPFAPPTMSSNNH